jgi:hypothetical protein
MNVYQQSATEVEHKQPTGIVRKEATYQKGRRSWSCEGFCLWLRSLLRQSPCVSLYSSHYSLAEVINFNQNFLLNIHRLKKV